ncbi:MAG: MBL fold metallo-hydrolase, partial [Deltaproteobacteria bacterium]
MSVRICVLGSGSRGNSTLIATERTRVLVDAGFSKKETYKRLASVGEKADSFDAIVISHEHSDHINGLQSLALDLKAPIYISAPTREVIRWDPRVNALEEISAGKKFTIGDIE